MPKGVGYPPGSKPAKKRPMRRTKKLKVTKGVITPRRKKKAPMKRTGAKRK